MKNDPAPPAGKKEIFSWCCYDFANSSFTTVIVTVVYSAYFIGTVCGGSDFANTLWALALAVSQLFVIFLGPWFGAVADRRANKKQFLTLLAIGCAAMTALLYLTGPGMVWLAFALVAAGNFMFSLGENFCASFLPEISTPETSGKISGYGWSFGYLGGLVSLGLALAVTKSGGDTRLIFPITGLFFLLAALPTLLFLKERAVPQPPDAPKGPGALTHLFGSLGRLRENPNLLRFLISFFLYMCGLCSIVAFAAVYAGKKIGFSQEQIIQLFLSLQVSSALGAFGFGFLQDKLGARFTLAVSLVLWVAVCIWAAVCSTQMEFLIVGNLAGIVIGSTQSASRAVVSLLTPPGREGEYFGLWGFFGKLAAVAGPLVFGIVADVVDLRWAIGMLAVFFVGGLIMLRGLNLTSSARKTA